jgi:hypothetical protein
MNPPSRPLSALATSGAAALKMRRADARAVIIRTALIKKLLASAQVPRVLPDRVLLGGRFMMI